MAAKPKAIRGMNPDDRAKLLSETRAELMHERGLAAMGGSVKNPGKIRDLRTTIARVLTVEQALGEATKHAARPKANPASRPGRPAKATASANRPGSAPKRAPARGTGKAGTTGGAR